MEQAPVRFSFGVMMILLLMVVSAGVSLLLFFAMRVPAITSELNAWFGRPDAVIDPAAGRQAQLTFALFLYTAPIALGILVYSMHFAVNWLIKITRIPEQDDREFRMDAD